MQHDPTAPVGLFDSGVGGLTVAHAVRSALPAERLLYFGDTAHLPYGEKSVAAIQAYTVKTCDFFLEQGCKAVLIACNSASAAAYELAKEYVASRAQVFNVIDPVARYVAHRYEGRAVGLIATRATVNAGAYAQRLQALAPSVQLRSLATPLLVPMIEEGFFNGKISRPVIETYLQDPSLSDIQALILGCTHFPLIKTQIAQHFADRGRTVEVLDGSALVAQALQSWLDENRLRNDTAELPRFFVSDYTRSFQETAAQFFGRPVRLEEHRLWE